MRRFEKISMIKNNSNSIVSSKFQRAAVSLVFFALLPGFFFYHTLLGIEMISPVLGGFFGPIVIAAFPVVVFVFFSSVGKYKRSWNLVDAVFVGLMGYTLIVAGFNFADGRWAAGNMGMLIWSASGVIYNFALYMLARLIPIESTLFRRILLASLILMFLIALLNVGETGIFYLREQNGNEEAVATYQGFARSIAVVSIMAIILVDRGYFFIVASFVGVAALFLNGARTELACFLVSVLIASWLRFGVFKSIVLGVVFIFAAGLSMSLLSSGDYEKFVTNNRNLELLDLSESTSLAARSKLEGDAVNVISANPIWGDYASYLANGGVGSYAHNLLSAWVNLGIIGFFAYIFIFFGMAVFLLKTAKGVKKRNASWRILIVFFGFTLIAMIFGKDYTYLFFGLTVGFYGRAVAEVKLNNGSSST